MIIDFQKKHQEDLQRLQEFCLMDDDFMAKVFEDEACAEFLLQIILDREDLTIRQVQGQQDLKNLQGRSVRLDIFAVDADGKVYNVEIQRSDKGANVKRSRYNSSLLDANITEPGENYEKLRETYVIFITENDILKDGLPIYHIDRTMQETGKLFEDESHIIYVNAKIKDETKLGMLMHDFSCKSAADMKYGILAERVRYFKEDEKGVEVMCRAMEALRNEAMEEGRAIGHEEGRIEGHAAGKAEGRIEGHAAGKAEGRIEGHAAGKAEGQTEGRLKTIICFLINGGTKEDVKRYLQATEEEIEKAEEMLCVPMS